MRTERDGVVESNGERWSSKERAEEKVEKEAGGMIEREGPAERKKRDRVWQREEQQKGERQSVVGRDGATKRREE